MITTPEARLAEIGLALPDVAPPLAAYARAVRTGRYVYTSGQLPIVNGTLVATGKVGARVSTEEAADLARRCALNALAAIRTVIGELSDIRRLVKVVGYVASAPEFTDQPAVINGASDLLRTVFGERGAHARSAVGVASLPLDSPVEIELIVEVGSV